MNRPFSILTMFFLLLGASPKAAISQKTSIPALKMEALVLAYRNAPGVMVVNFWSTWCAPCIAEIPHFISVLNRHKEASLLLVSLDTRDMYASGRLKKFIDKRKWKAPFAWLDETNADYYCPQVDERWSGVIPATVIIHPQRNYFAFFEESLTAERLEAEIKKAAGQ